MLSLFQSPLPRRCAQTCTAVAAALAALSTAPAASAADAGASAPEPIVVTATRSAAQTFDIPATINVVDGDDVRESHAGVNLSESVGTIPGLTARDRQNYAQDEQVSIRGFGARSSFGLRGVRVYVDGIPSTLPDGQGWVSNIDLNSVDRLEVLRGPFSALYGNSSGGVIQAFTQPGSSPATVSADTVAGSFGEVRESLRASGSRHGDSQTGGLATDQSYLSYDADLSHFATAGYRPHSAAIRNFANLRLDMALDPSVSRWMLVVNSTQSPTAQDPLGLKRAQFDTNPRSVDPAAGQYNTRKTFDQTQVGLSNERKLGQNDDLQATLYAGHRNAEQFQAIPASTQAAATSPGGVIDLGRDYNGVDVHWNHRATLLGGGIQFTTGATYDDLTEAREGYRNFVGTTTSPTYGVAGALRRNQRNLVQNFDQYGQALWNVLPGWTVNAGVRHSLVQFNSFDAAITGVGAADNQSINYGATLPVFGVAYAHERAWRVYANFGRGFETPTLNELAYRPNGAAGLNTALKADHSDNAELGFEWRNATLGRFQAALFHIRTSDEIVTQTNTGGRSVYQNAGRTGRDGAELSWRGAIGSSLTAQASYTYLNARYLDAYLTCTVTPCATPTAAVAAGNAIPSIARSTAAADLTWHVNAWQAGLEAHAASSMAADDINSQYAAGYATFALRSSYRWTVQGWDMHAFARIDNLTSRQYAGSVIVDETSLRFFEPAPTRSYLVGVGASYRF